MMRSLTLLNYNTDAGDVHQLEQYLEPYDLPSTLKPHEVPSNCELQDYITKTLNVKYGFRRGHTYYEFTNEVVENILKGKEVLLQDKKKPARWFRLVQPDVVVTGSQGLYFGEGIALKNFGDQYRVFIQSFGSGARHLPCDSSILYNHSIHPVNIIKIIKY
jgi:hypothetical protein